MRLWNKWDREILGLPSVCVAEVTCTKIRQEYFSRRVPWPENRGPKTEAHFIDEFSVEIQMRLNFCIGMIPPLHNYDDVINWKHFPRYWAFVRGIHRWPVNSSHKGQFRGAFMFSLICAWMNGWVKVFGDTSTKNFVTTIFTEVLLRLKHRQWYGFG